MPHLLPQSILTSHLLSFRNLPHPEPIVHKMRVNPQIYPAPEADTSKDDTTKVGVDLETILQGERAKIEKSMRKEYSEQLKAVEADRDTLKKELEKRDDADRDRIITQYLPSEIFKDKEIHEKRTNYYRDLAKKYSLPNAELENLLKDHYEVKQIDVTASLGGKKPPLEQQGKAGRNFTTR